MPRDPNLRQLSQRHILLAYMLLNGHTKRAAAAKLDMNPQYVGVLSNSPLFQAYMESLRRELKDTTFDELQDWLRVETAPTLQRLKELRDQHDELPTALGATREILARIDPIKTKSEETRTLVLRIDAAGRQEMGAVLAEDGEVVGSPIPTLASPDAGSTPVRLRTLDEALTDYAGDPRA